MYSVLLYYIYSPIENVVEYRDIHHQFCIDNHLLGRIIIAPEGLNGTVSGTVEDCEKYMAWVKSDPRFSQIDFKVESHHQLAFKKLYVRVKKEIVHSELPVNPLVKTGKHLEPTEFKAMLNDPDVVLVDMRSNYEHAVGHFKGAVRFDMENLRELPKHISEIEHLIPNKERENVSVYELDKTNHFQNFDLQKILANLSFVYKVDEQLAQKSMYTEGSYLLLAKLNQESISKNQNYLCFQNGQFEITGEIKSAENAYLIIGEIQSKGRKRRDLQSILDRLEKVEKALENIKK